MSDLPDGWELAAVGDICTVQLGRQRSPKNHDGPHMRPYLRSANVTWSGINLSDVKEMNFDPSDAARFELADGDILLNEASGSPNEVGKPAVWRDQIPGACFQNTLLRVRSKVMDELYLYWFFYGAALTGRFGEAGRGVNIRHLGKHGLMSFPIAVPPLAEQRRIVAAIEEHFSRLDAADASVKHAIERTASLRKSAARRFRTLGAEFVPLGEVVDNHDGTRVPIKSADRALMQGQYRYYGASGVIDHVDEFLFDGCYLLISEDGANLLARAKPIAFEVTGQFWVNNHAHVVAARGGLNQSFLCAYLNSIDLASYVTGSAQPKITQRNMNRIPVPIPPLGIQEEVVDELSNLSDQCNYLTATIGGARRRSGALRQSILAASFSGHLIPQNPSDEPASAFLERIGAGRAASISSGMRKTSW